VALKHFTDLAPNGVYRIERTQRVLEYQGHVSPAASGKFAFTLAHQLFTI
jgi:hypothetical protein